MNKDNTLESSAINETTKGIFTAIFERAAFGEPLQRMKYDFQVRKQLNFSFFWLYSSFYANSANMVITTGAQFYFNYIAMQLTNKILSDECTFQKSLIESFSAGALSAVLTSPIEAAMINQSTSNRTFLESAKFLKQSGYRNFYRGLTATVFREAIFTSSYISLTPHFKSYLQDKYSMKDEATWVLSVFGIGLFASYASQPFDTINTIQKSANINNTISISKVLKTHKTKDIFKGAMLRAIGVMWAIGMYNLGPRIYDDTREKIKKVELKK